MLEQNTLFSAILERLGFRFTALAARVRLGASRVLAKTQILLMVDFDGGPWLADVGFGTGGVLLLASVARPGDSAGHRACCLRSIGENVGDCPLPAPRRKFLPIPWEMVSLLPPGDACLQSAKRLK